MDKIRKGKEKKKLIIVISSQPRSVWWIAEKMLNFFFTCWTWTMWMCCWWTSVKTGTTARDWAIPSGNGSFRLPFCAFPNRSAHESSWIQSPKRWNLQVWREWCSCRPFFFRKMNTPVCAHRIRMKNDVRSRHRQYKHRTGVGIECLSLKRRSGN